MPKDKRQLLCVTVIVSSVQRGEEDCPYAITEIARCDVTGVSGKALFDHIAKFKDLDNMDIVKAN